MRIINELHHHIVTVILASRMAAGFMGKNTIALSLGKIEVQAFLPINPISLERQ